MQFGCGALSFMLLRKNQFFPITKDLLAITTKCWLLLRWFRQPMSHSQLLNNPSINLLSFRSGVENSEIDPSPEAQIVHNRGHG